jgi:hypothetical protein
MAPRFTRGQTFGQKSLSGLFLLTVIKYMTNTKKIQSMTNSSRMKKNKMLIYVG